MTRIAIAIIHGVEIDDPRFADRAIEMLRRGFLAALPPGRRRDADEALCIETVHWAPVVEPRQKELLQRLYERGGDKLFERLKRLVLRMNQGSVPALLPFTAMLASRWLPGISGPHYPVARWVAMHFIGDIIAYQPSGSARANYDAVQGILAESLGRLAARAGGEAPLCVLAHSYGSIIASDFFYDLEQGLRSGGPTPLEQGRTLSHFYTMGSPIALWALRYSGELDRPLTVPAATLERYHPGLRGEWVNFYDDDDVIAYPLRGLGRAYAEAVTRDTKVRLEVPPVSWSPLCHPYYWSDDSVILPISRALARAWEQLSSGA